MILKQKPMCIINLPARVSGTRIFVSPNVDKTRQLTVYSNSVMTDKEGNVMILPVPYPESVKFIDLSKYTKIFKDLQRSFEEEEMSLDLGFATNSVKYRGYVPTIDVGSYRISLCHSYQDLDRINPTEFGIVQNHIKKILTKYYERCGFIVCKLRPGRKVDYHPLAYSHQIMSNSKLFVPTRHQHNHGKDGGSMFGRFAQISQGPGFGMAGAMSNINESPENFQEEDESDWDHEIYSFNTTEECGNCSLEDDHIYLKSHLVKGFRFGPVNSFRKYEISGYFKNRDLYFDLDNTQGNKLVMTN